MLGGSGDSWIFFNYFSAIACFFYRFLPFYIFSALVFCGKVINFGFSFGLLNADILDKGE